MCLLTQQRKHKNKFAWTKLHTAYIKRNRSKSLMSKTSLKVEPNSLVCVVVVPADDKDVDVSNAVGDTVGDGVAEVDVDIVTDVDSTTIKRRHVMPVITVAHIQICEKQISKQSGIEIILPTS